MSCNAHVEKSKASASAGGGCGAGTTSTLLRFMRVCLEDTISLWQGMRPFSSKNCLISEPVNDQNKNLSEIALSSFDVKTLQYESITTETEVLGISKDL